MPYFRNSRSKLSRKSLALAMWPKRKSPKPTKQKRDVLGIGVKLTELDLCIPGCLVGRTNIKVPMVPCGMCDGWFHFPCIGLPEGDGPRRIRGLYFCRDCLVALRCLRRLAGHQREREARFEAVEALVAALDVEQALLRERLDRVCAVNGDLFARMGGGKVVNATYAALLRENAELKHELVEAIAAGDDGQASRESGRRVAEQGEVFKEVEQMQIQIAEELGESEEPQVMEDSCAPESVEEPAAPEITEEPITLAILEERLAPVLVKDPIATHNTLQEQPVPSKVPCESVENMQVQTITIDEDGESETMPKTISSFDPASQQNPFDDNYLYCIDCDKLQLGDCPTHGPPRRILDSIVCDSDLQKSVSSLPPGLEIGMSSQSEGKVSQWSGVRADMDIERGVMFGPFKGKVVPMNSTEALASMHYWVIMNNGKPSHIVDANDMSSANWLRYVNFANSHSQGNIRAIQYKGHIFYRTITHITKGTELLLGNNHMVSKVLPPLVQQEPFVLLQPLNQCVNTDPVGRSNQSTCVVPFRHPVPAHGPPRPNLATSGVSPNTSLTTTRLAPPATVQPIGPLTKKLCHVCGLVVQSEQELVFHHQVAHGLEPFYKCANCQLTFRTYFLMCAHASEQHNVKLSLSCEMCHCAYSDHNELLKHFQQEHAGNSGAPQMQARSRQQPPPLPYQQTLKRRETNAIIPSSIRELATGLSDVRPIRVASSIAVPGPPTAQSTMIAVPPSIPASFFCDVCMKPFTNRAAVLEHVQIKHGINNYNQSFPSTSAISAAATSPLVTVTVSSPAAQPLTIPYRCMVCMVTFSSHADARSHLHGIHGTNDLDLLLPASTRAVEAPPVIPPAPVQTFIAPATPAPTKDGHMTCIICQTVFMNKINYFEHLKTRHHVYSNGNIIKYPCRMCCQEFQSMQCLASHACHKIQANIETQVNHTQAPPLTQEIYPRLSTRPTQQWNTVQNSNTQMMRVPEATFIPEQSLEKCGSVQIARVEQVPQQGWTPPQITGNQMDQNIIVLE